MLIGIIEDRSKKYLKNKINVYPTLPPDPLIKISINESSTITVNKILLKKLSYPSNFPNLVYDFFIFNDNLVSLPV